MITNLYREHTDWHGSEEQYRADKLRIFELPGVRAAVRPLGDRGGWPLVGARPSRSRCAGGTTPRTSRGPRGDRGRRLRAAAAAGGARGPQRAPAPSPDGPHDADGVEWVDDSISTTPIDDRGARGLRRRPVVLIAGGRTAARTTSSSDRRSRRARPRRADHAPRHRSTAGRGRRGPRPLREPHVDSGRHAGSDATGRNARHARRRVLLSPAAPSYNAYANFEQRGDDFAACARAVALRA